MNYSDIFAQSNAIKQRIVSHRRKIHSFAETGFETAKTSLYIKSVLEELGVETKDVCKNGVCAFVHGKKDGKAFLVRSDIDALPVIEATGLDFASDNGCMHACGHDMHAAMLLGCAELLCKMKDEFSGTVALLFQPAEELLAGAKSIIDNGFDLTCFDGAMTLHVISPSDKKTGTVVLPKGGTDAPSADFFTVKIMGKGCHGSSPWLGTDPVSCACNIVTTLDTIRAREVSAYFPFTLTVASINAGSGYNVIPESAELCGSLRCYDENVRTFVKKRINEICAGICSAYGCKESITFESGCPSFVVDKELTDRFQNVLCETLGQENVFRAPEEQSYSLKGSEDFSYFSQVLPSFTAAIPAGFMENKTYSSQMHSPTVMFDEDALPVGCSVFTACTLDFLKN